jgi:hypothetical protein
LLQAWNSKAFVEAPTLQVGASGITSPAEIVLMDALGRHSKFGSAVGMLWGMENIEHESVWNIILAVCIFCSIGQGGYSVVDCNKEGFGRYYLVFKVFSFFGVFLIFLFFLHQFLHHLAFAIAMHFRSRCIIAIFCIGSCIGIIVYQHKNSAEILRKHG